MIQKGLQTIGDDVACGVIRQHEGCFIPVRAFEKASCYMLVGYITRGERFLSSIFKHKDSYHPLDLSTFDSCKARDFVQAKMQSRVALLRAKTRRRGTD